MKCVEFADTCNDYICDLPSPFFIILCITNVKPNLYRFNITNVNFLYFVIFNKNSTFEK